MKNQQVVTDAAKNESQKPRRKHKRRHTRVDLNSLKPVPPVFAEGSLSQCPKCKGLIFIDGGETLSQIIVRCLNCGWQPQQQTPMIKETEESRSMRSLTNKFVSEGDWDQLPVCW